jgi:hypothetical protein
MLLPLLLAACADPDTGTAAPPPCGLQEGAWALTIGGDDPVCTNGLETANGAAVTVTCVDESGGVSSLTWEGKGNGQAITCTLEDAGLRCAFGGINLTATVSADGRSLSGEWSGISCADAWSGEAG